jgi:outer membrane protein
MRGILLIILSSMFCASLCAQETKIWSLQDCIDYALEHNIDIRQSSLHIETAKNEINAAWANLFPDLNANFGYNFNFGLNIDPVTNIIGRENRQTSNLGLSSQWVLFDGFRNRNNIDRARLERDVRETNYKQLEIDITLNITGAYLQILLSKEVLKIAREQVRISELQVRRMNDLVKAGAEPRGSLYELEAQLARDEQNLVRNENDLTMNVLNLVQLLQLPDASGFEVINPVEELPPGDIFNFSEDYIFQRAVDLQPGVKGALLNMNRADKDITIAKGQRYPTLSMVGAISTNYSNQIPEFDGYEQVPVVIGQTAGGEPVFGVQQIPVGMRDKPVMRQVNDNINEFVGISLQIPIYSRLRIRNDIRNAQIQKQIAELDYERELNRVRQDVQTAYTDALASLKSYRAAEKAVTSSQEAFNYASERFRVGAIQQYDFENAKNALARARAERASALYEYVFKINVLHFYVNNEFKF